MRSVSVDLKNMTAIVGAGCNLDYDPYDPSGTSTHLNGLLPILQSHGLAISNVPDACHQSIAGYISTGSSGATAKHSFHEYILSLTIVDGLGNIQIFNRSMDEDNPFYAIGVSMGLLGIITSVTIQCNRSYDIVGTETTSDLKDTHYDFFGPGSKSKPSLQQHFTDNDFVRTLWWPFHTLHRAISWRANKMEAQDYNKITGTPERLKVKRYQPVFPKVLGSYIPSEAFASSGFTLIASWPEWLYDLIGRSPAEVSPRAKKAIQKFESLAPNLYPVLINLYFPKNDAKHPPQQFWDRWNGSLPMDRIEFSNHLMNLDYAELWFPITEAQRVVDTLQDFYKKGGAKATGFYTVEVLPAKATSFWMSPGYHQDSIRLNFMWFKRGAKTPKRFYQQYFDLFRKKSIHFRVHWGKYLPKAKSSSGVAYLRDQYPKWGAFMSLRKKMDPHNVFLTSYWTKHLGIE